MGWFNIFVRGCKWNGERIFFELWILYGLFSLLKMWLERLGRIKLMVFVKDIFQIYQRDMGIGILGYSFSLLIIS